MLNIFYLHFISHLCAQDMCKVTIGFIRFCVLIVRTGKGEPDLAEPGRYPPLFRNPLLILHAQYIIECFRLYSARVELLRNSILVLLFNTKERQR